MVTKLEKKYISDNPETDISRELKKMKGKRELIGVAYEEGDFIFTFSDQQSKTSSSFVKQFKKTPELGKVSAVSLAILSFNNEQFDDLMAKGFKDVGVIETKKSYLVFFTKS